MAKVKLIKAISYSGIVKATSQNPIVDVTEEQAEQLIQTGYFEMCHDPVVPDKDDETKNPVSDFENMTKADLTTYAEENGINIDSCKTKADIMQAISVVEGGSSSIIEFQE